MLSFLKCEKKVGSLAKEQLVFKPVVIVSQSVILTYRFDTIVFFHFKNPPHVGLAIRLYKFELLNKFLVSPDFRKLFTLA